MSAGGAGGDAARRLRASAGWLCACGGFLLAGAVLATSLVGRTTFLPADLWMSSVPFSVSGAEARRYVPHNVLLTDSAFLYAPPLAVVHRTLREGAFPLWNRFMRGGEPLLGTGESGPLEPLNLPILLMPWPLGFAWAAWLRFGLMWAGAYLFGRELGLSRAWSIALAVAYSFAPGFAAHFQQLPRAIAHVGIPWLLLGVERLAHATARGPRAGIRAALPIALAQWVVASSGYPPGMLTATLAAVAYLLVRVGWSTRDALLAKAVGLAALGLGFAMAAPSLMPFLEFLRDSATYAEREGGGEWVFPTEVFRLFWNPDALGSPITGAAHAWTGVYNFEEEQQYIGLVPWVFLIGSIPSLRRATRLDVRRMLALGGLALFTAALAFGWPPVHPWVSGLPPFSRNSNPRMLILTQVLVAAVAALAARDWPAQRPRAHPRAFAMLAGLAALGGGGVLAMGLASRWDARPPLALGAAIALFAAGRLAASEGQRRAASALLPLLMLADVAPVYHDYYPQPPRAWADPARALRNLPAALRDQEAPRVAFEAFTPSNLPAAFGVEDVRAYGFPVPTRYDAYMNELLSVENAETFFRRDLERPEVVTALQRTCAQWLMTSAHYPDPSALALERVWQSGPLALYRMLAAAPCAAWYADDEVETVADLSHAVARTRASLGERSEPILVERAGEPASSARAAAAGEVAPMRWQGPNRLEIAVPEAARGRDGWLVVRVSWDAGWSAFAGDRPLELAPAQVRFLAVRTPAGTERVALRYWPPHLSAWLAIAAASYAALIALAIWSRARTQQGVSA